MIEKVYFGEGKNIEFKREIPQKHDKFLKDIIAFSNCTGGKVILGIEDRTNKVYGIGEANPFRLADDISNMISDACTPQINPDITIQTLDGKTVLVIDIAPGKFRPYYLKSAGKEESAYIRINGTSRAADMRMLQELELEGQRIYYDTMQEIGMEYSEETAKKLCESMKEVALSSCKTEEEKAGVPDMTIAKLEDMGLLCRMGRDYVPTHAFNLMTENRMKHAKIQCALFKGTSRDEFIDRKEFRGPIYEQIEEAYQFVLRHINMSAQINGIVRRDVYELPVRAVREAIINAVTHRSYMDDSCVQVSVYDDRMEVLSPGMLYGGLDLEAALEGKSKCRNAAVSEAFHYMKLIEAWGTGLGRIRNSCREYGLKEPVIDEFGDGFRVVFFRKEMEENQDEIQKSGNPEIRKSGNPEIRKSGNPALPDTELFIIKYIRENDQCTTAEIAGLLDITGRRARGILGSLVKKGVLRKVGNARNTIYQAGGNFPHGE
ncbi:MAG: putative DNA binding domain-containing protein [Lachnospiraceae bacterium]